MDRVYLMIGCQGGAGVTTATACLADHLKRSGELVFLIEADPCGDALDILSGSVDKVIRVDLKERAGWNQMIREVSEAQQMNVLVHLPYSHIDQIKTYAPALIRATVRLGRFTVSFCMMGAGRKSMTTARDIEASLRGSRPHIFVNGAIARASQLKSIRKSGFGENVSANYGEIHLFPVLSERVIDTFHMRSRSLYHATRLLPFWAFMSKMHFWRQRGIISSGFRKMEKSLRRIGEK